MSKKPANRKTNEAGKNRKPNAQAMPHSSGMSTHAQAARWILPLILSIYVVLTALLIARVPLGKAPDEIPHMLYVERLAQSGHLPMFDPTEGTRNPGYEFHQPPLYYALCAPLWRMLGAGAQNYACRVVSLLCGALTLWLLWNAVAALFPKRRELAVLATAFAALLPMHQAVGAAASNDALAGVLCAAVFHRIAIMSTHVARMRDAIVLGALVGLGMLTKSTALVMGIVALGALWFATRRQAQAQAQAAEEETDGTRSTPSPLVLCGVMMGVALLLCGPWLARNQRLYGDVFALGVFNKAFGSEGSGALATGFFSGLSGIPPLVYGRATLLILFCTFWGVFGGPNKALDIFIPFSSKGPQPEASSAMPAMIVCALATAIVLFGLLRCVSDWRSRRATTDAISMREQTRNVALALWLLGLGLVFAAWLQFNTHYFQAQARYFHPALLPLALGFALGWRKMFSGRALWTASALFALLLIGLSLWNVFGWRTLV